MKQIHPSTLKRYERYCNCKKLKLVWTTKRYFKLQIKRLQGIQIRRYRTDQKGFGIKGSFNFKTLPASMRLNACMAVQMTLHVTVNKKAFSTDLTRISHISSMFSAENKLNIEFFTFYLFN